MEPISYFRTSIVWLSLEDYHNAGLTPEQTKAAIEEIQDGSHSIWCERQGINDNWNVRTMRTTERGIEAFVQEIEYRLNVLLRTYKEQKNYSDKTKPQLTTSN